MANNQTTKAIVVSSVGINPHTTVMQIALVHPDGITDVSLLKKQAAQADSVAATVGAVVTDFNALLAKLRLAGVIS